MTRSSFPWQVIALALLSTSGLWAQSTGSLSGIVRDQSDAVVADALISLYRAEATAPSYQDRTSKSGSFSFLGINPETYTIVAEKEGLAPSRYENVTVSPGVERTVNGIILTVEPRPTKPVDTGVQLSDPPIAENITYDQIQRLPEQTLDPLALAKTQAGVTNNGTTYTVINGLRTSLANVTYDGVNVQDNGTRLYALDQLPNYLRLDQVLQFTLVASNQGSIYGNGASQIAFVSPTGGNALHGDVFYLLSPNHASADSWFHSSNGNLDENFRNNQGGFRIGGPIRRNKLFYYSNYSFSRIAVEQGPIVANVPTAQFRNGVYSYTDSSGQPAQINLPQAIGGTIDPALKSIFAALPLPNASTGDPNFGNYVFNQSQHVDSDNAMLRLDYQVSSTDSIGATYAVNRLHGDEGFSPFGKISPQYGTFLGNLGSISWRLSLTPRLTNELRGGFDLDSNGNRIRNASPYVLQTTLGSFLPTASPSTFVEAHRLQTINLQDNASYVIDRHKFQFGFQSQILRSDLDRSPLLVYELGTTAGSDTLSQLAGIFTGSIYAAEQTFVLAPGSAPVTGIVRHAWRYDNYSGYAQDNWSVRPGLSLTFGLRYEYFTPFQDSKNLMVEPEPQSANYAQSLLSPTSNLNFVKGGFYRPDHRNFAPSIGLAWDPFHKGRTVFRAAFGISYVNDDLITAVANVLDPNAILKSVMIEQPNGSSFVSNLGTLSNPVSLPAPNVSLPVPVSAIAPLLYFGKKIGEVDPTLRTPYVEQWSMSLQHQIASFVIDARYLGNHAVGLLRGVNLNQIDVETNTYANPAIPSGAYILGNFSRSEYNSFQIDGTRRFRAGLQAQFNYSYSKVLTDSPRVSTSANIPYLDARNPGLDWSRAPFDLNHVFKANFIYDLPFGTGRRFPVRFNRLLGGWGLSGIITAQSGNPFSILAGGDPVSGVAPANAYSIAGAAPATAVSTVSGSALNQLVQFHFTGNGPSIVAPSAIANGSASPQFFVDPALGTPGTLQPRRFTGPSVFNLDVGVQKLVALTERQRLEFRFEGINVLNHPWFIIGDQYVDSQSFGSNIGVNPPRSIQFSAYYRF